MPNDSGTPGESGTLDPTTARSLASRTERQTFLPGLLLARRFYTEAVRPLLPGLPHSAARIGPGSEVLGYDTPRSADHEWGPRLQLFVHDDDPAAHDALSAHLAENLPKSFLGHPTHFAPTGTDGDRDIRVMTPTDGPVHHRVEITTLPAWLTRTLGFDPTRGVTPASWLTTPTQRLAEVTAGEVFHDGLDTLVPTREALSWYPPDIWRHVLAAQWQRVAQEEAFVARSGEAGDELGSAVTAARLVRDLMRLCLLMDRRYPPYGKWLGTAFSRTPLGARLTPVLRAALTAPDWPTREARLAHAYEEIAAAHNTLGLTAPLDPATRPYHSRPYRVLRADRFAEALAATVTDPAIRALPLLGAIDQHVDNADALNMPKAQLSAVLNRASEG